MTDTNAKSKNIDCSENFINSLKFSAPLQLTVFKKLRALAQREREYLNYSALQRKLGWTAPERIPLIFEKHILKCLQQHFSDVEQPTHQEMGRVWEVYQTKIEKNPVP